MSQPLPSYAVHITIGPDGQMIESDPIPNVAGLRTRTAKEILRSMIARRNYYGCPLPEGYVAPPGIDIDELLKQLPPLPPNCADSGA